MTPAQLLFWRRVQARAAVEMPGVSSKILEAFQELRDTLSDADLMTLVNDRMALESAVQQVLSDRVLDAAFGPVQEQIQTVMQRGMQYFARTLAVPGGTPAVAFNVLNADVLTALQTLDTRVMQTLKDDVRETVREVAAQSLAAGTGPRAIAREIRSSIGLASNQIQAINNYRVELANGSRAALSRNLRDKRSDSTVKKAGGKKGIAIPPDKIEKMVEKYRRNWISFNAQTNARTITLQSFKAGQRLTWVNAVNNGTAPADRLMHQWIGVDDDRERPTHVAMNNEIQHYLVPYSNGQLIPGDDEYNCRCLDRFFIARAQ